MVTRMAEIVNEAGKIKPVAVVNGRKVFTAPDAQILNKAALMEEKALGSVDLGVRPVNPDGTFAGCRVRNVVVDPENLFNNRFKKDGNTYEVVTDYRAIKEQASGRVYTDNIPVTVIHKQNGKLEVKHVKMISADAFVRDFKQKLDLKSMISIFDLIQNTGTSMSTHKLEL